MKDFSRITAYVVIVILMGGCITQSPDTTPKETSTDIISSLEGQSNLLMEKQING